MAVTVDELDVLLKEGKVAVGDRDFATSLVTRGRSFGLSVKQAEWVSILIRRSSAPVATRSVGDFSGVYALFLSAKAHLKYPKILLKTDSGYPLRLYLSGSRSKMPDTVNVTDNGGFDDGLWFGRIATDGTWTPNNRVDSQTGMTARLADAECTLKKLAADPEGVASAYGRGTGSCCFCSRPLDDARSTAVGYGPVCAENFSLSWGNKIRARVPTTEVEKVSEPVGQRRVRVRRAA